MTKDISATIEIAAPVERVWTVLTSEGLVEQWLGCMGFRAEIGVVFYMQQDPARRAAGDITGATHCEVEALEPPHRLAFSWYYPQTPKTRVTITLEPTAKGARANLVHSGWDQFPADQIAAIRDALAGGWTSYVLPALQRVAEAA